MKGMGNMGDMLGKAKQLQNKMLQMQEEIKQRTVEASVNNGAVTVTANGAKEITAVKISKELIASQDGEIIQDLVMLAVNEALSKAQNMMEEEMKKITGGMGLNLPGMF